MNNSGANNDTSDIIVELGKSYTYDVMETAERMHYITSAYFGPVIAVLGLIGNVLSIIVWQKKAMSSSTGLYLIAQAVNDIGVLIFFFLSDSLVVLCPHIKTSYSYAVFHAYVAWPMFYFFVINSIWTLVGVTVDRYILVCWINQSKMLCSQKAAQSSVALITMLCFMINAPHFNTYYPIPDEARAPNATAYAYTEFGRGTGSQLYEFWVHCMFLVLAPWVTIMFMNMAILRRINILNKQMNPSRGEKAQLRAQRKEMQLTKLLLTVTFTFLVLIALQCITQCFFMLQPARTNMKVVNEAFSVAKLGIVINSSINFLLYCLSGQRFRKELRFTLYKMCRCRCLVPIPDASELYVSQDRSTCSESAGSKSIQHSNLSM